MLDFGGGGPDWAPGDRDPAEIDTGPVDIVLWCILVVLILAGGVVLCQMAYASGLAIVRWFS